MNLIQRFKTWRDEKRYADGFKWAAGELVRTGSDVGFDLLLRSPDADEFDRGAWAAWHAWMKRMRDAEALCDHFEGEAAAMREALQELLLAYCEVGGSPEDGVAKDASDVLGGVK